jgi:hypothetical protein
MEGDRGTRYVVRWRKEIIAAAMPRRGRLPPRVNCQVDLLHSVPEQIVRSVRALSPGTCSAYAAPRGVTGCHAFRATAPILH